MNNFHLAASRLNFQVGRLAYFLEMDKMVNVIGVEFQFSRRGPGPRNFYERRLGWVRLG